VQRIPRLEAAKNRLCRHALGMATEGRCPRRRHLLRPSRRLEYQEARSSASARPIIRGPSSDDRAPSEDVESVLRWAASIRSWRWSVHLMKSLKPWGETPLYLSVVQAVGQSRR